MQGLEQNLQDSLNEDEPLEGACKFACSGALAMQLYPDFLAHQCQYPGLQVSVEAASMHLDLSIILTVFTQKRFRPLPAYYEWFKKTIIQQVNNKLPCPD